MTVTLKRLAGSPGTSLAQGPSRRRSRGSSRLSPDSPCLTGSAAQWLRASGTGVRVLASSLAHDLSKPSNFPGPQPISSVKWGVLRLIWNNVWKALGNVPGTGYRCVLLTVATTIHIYQSVWMMLTSEIRGQNPKLGHVGAVWLGANLGFLSESVSLCTK